MTLSILIFLQIVASVFLAEDTIKKTAKGAITLDRLSTMGLFFLRWRANANYKSELTYLRNVFGKIALVLAAMYVAFFFMGSYEGSRKLAMPIFFFMTLWAAMKFGIDFRGGVRDQYKTVLLCTFSPWLVLFAEYLTGTQSHSMQKFSAPLVLLGFETPPDWLIALMFSVLGFLFGLLTALLSVLLFSIVPLLFLFLIVFSSTLSRKAMNIKPDTLTNAALLYTFILSPILFGLESKGLI